MSGWMSSGPAYSTRKTVRQAIWGPIRGRRQWRRIGHWRRGGQTKILHGDDALLAQAGVLDEGAGRVGDDGSVAALGNAQAVDRRGRGSGYALVELGGGVGQGNGGVGGQLPDGLAWGIGSAARHAGARAGEDTYREAARRE